MDVKSHLDPESESAGPVSEPESESEELNPLASFGSDHEHGLGCVGRGDRERRLQLTTECRQKQVTGRPIPTKGHL